MSDDHRPPLGRMLGGLESEAAEFADKPVRRPLAIGKMGGHRRDGRDREQREQPLERRPLIGVDRGENIVCRGHVLRFPIARLWPSCSRPKAAASNRLNAGSTFRLANHAPSGEQFADPGRKTRWRSHFDAKNAPFDRLTADEIDTVRDALDIAYFRPNETIIGRDKAPDSLFIVIKGLVEERDGEDLVALRGPGDAFDSRALVQGSGSNAFVAREETLCNLLPRDVTLRLINQNPRFASFFYLDIARQARRRLARGGGGAFRALAGRAGPRPLPASGGVHRCEGDDRRRRRADEGRPTVYALFVRDGDEVGILTRTRSPERGDSRSAAPSKARSDRSRTTRSSASRQDDLVSTALLKMTKHNKRRVAVTENGEFVGVLEDIDLLSFLAGNSQLVAGRIDRAVLGRRARARGRRPSTRKSGRCAARASRSTSCARSSPTSTAICTRSCSRSSRRSPSASPAA